MFINCFSTFLVSTFIDLTEVLQTKRQSQFVEFQSKLNQNDKKELKCMLMSQVLLDKYISCNPRLVHFYVLQDMISVSTQHNVFLDLHTNTALKCSTYSVSTCNLQKRYLTTKTTQEIYCRILIPLISSSLLAQPSY